MNGAESVLELAGDALARGLAQAGLEPASVEPVCSAVRLRLDAVAGALASAQVRRYLDAQWGFHIEHAAEELAEMRGVAEGYGIDGRELFAYLHLGVIADLADGCTAWARADARCGAMLAKNRDFRGEHLGLQRVFRHVDPAWPRRVLAVGSLGSPGAYSSGINSDGLALADTQVGTSGHGVGLLRYFLMTRLLARAATVAQALDLVAGCRHAGGGTLVLADAGGALAAVELTHGRVAVERRADVVARTNHFLDGATAGQWRPSSADPMADSSTQRLAAVNAGLAQQTGTLRAGDAFALMARHDGPAGVGLCRHGQDGDARTISCAVFETSPPALHFAAGPPCSATPLQVAP